MVLTSMYACILDTDIFIIASYNETGGKGKRTETSEERGMERLIQIRKTILMFFTEMC